MDKRALKSIIIELKNSGKTYQEISNILKENYNTNMSRQAVYGMYHRATSDKSIKHNEEIISATNDVVNYCAIGYNSIKIKELLGKEHNLSLNDITSIVENNKGDIKNAVKLLIESTMNKIRSNSSLEEMKQQTQYNNVTITDKMLRMIIKVSTEHIIYNDILKALENLYNISGNRKLINSIMQGLRFNITVKDLDKYISNKNKLETNFDLFFYNGGINEISSGFRY